MRPLSVLSILLFYFLVLIASINSHVSCVRIIYNPGITAIPIGLARNLHFSLLNTRTSNDWKYVNRNANGKFWFGTRSILPLMPSLNSISKALNYLPSANLLAQCRPGNRIKKNYPSWAFTRISHQTSLIYIYIRTSLL